MQAVPVKLIGGAVRFLRSIFGGGEEEGAEADHVMVSLVVLYDSYLELSIEPLRHSLNQVFPGEFLPPREQGNFVVDGAVPGATFMINCIVENAAGLFMLNNVPGPYTEFSDFIDYIAEPALRERAKAQNSWLSIDLINAITDVEDAYRFIGKMIARLAPDDAAFLVHPETYHSVVFDSEVRSQLAEGRRLFAIQ
jgi:hypothetical protein